VCARLGPRVAGVSDCNSPSDNTMFLPGWKWVCPFAHNLFSLVLRSSSPYRNSGTLDRLSHLLAWAMPAHEFQPGTLISPILIRSRKPQKASVKAKRTGEAIRFQDLPLFSQGHGMEHVTFGCLLLIEVSIITHCTISLLHPLPCTLVHKYQYECSLIHFLVEVLECPHFGYVVIKCGHTFSPSGVPQSDIL
jgi:hypothetical protein